jgi:hypothetical protein
VKERALQTVNGTGEAVNYMLRNVSAEAKEKQRK